MNDILIYVDDGSSFEVLLREIGRELDHGRGCLRPVMAEDVTTALFANAGTLVMPGGADLPYCARLNGAGNACIRAFVEAGGAYLGVCAGAYYACRSLIFHGGRPDEISGSRELGLVNAQAIGSLDDFGPFYDLTMRGASVPRVEWEGLGSIRAFYNGGPRFDVEGDDVSVFARFTDAGGAPAGVECAVGYGKAVLVAVHVEVTRASLDLALSHLADGASYRRLPATLGTAGKAPRQAFRDLLRRANVPLKPD